MVRGEKRRDTITNSVVVIFKFGVAIAISVAAPLFYSFLSLPKKINMNPPPPPGKSSNQVDSEGIKSLINDEAFNSSDNQNDYNQTCNSCTQNGDRDQTLLPAFEEMVNNFSMTNPREYVTPERDVETIEAYESKLEPTKREEYEEEINKLNNMVDFLQKRVSTLEKDLLQYYGLKEQESTIRELQNRVKIHNTEAKLLNLKIEALQVDNKKQTAKLVNYSKTVSDLESAKETIDFLKKKLKDETEYNKKQLLSLQERVKKMRDHELEAVSGNPSDELKVQRVKELEGEAEQLRNINNNLRVENLELARKLELAQTSYLQEVHKAEALKVETNILRQQNEEFSKQVEQIQSSWCEDIEELVYLRWINACLRYEVRNYQSEPGKTSSRDLSKTLSPKSEHKAKQLILEYANKQGLEDKGRHLIDSDFDQWSFSQFSQSNHSDNGEFDDDSSLEHSSGSKTDNSSKKRIFSKLRKLLRGEDENNSSRELAFHDSPLYFHEKSVNGNVIRRSSIGSERKLKDFKAEEIKELESRRRYSDLGLPRVSKSLVFGREGVADMAEDGFDEISGLAEERLKLVKYAQGLKETFEENSKKLHRRAVSHS